MDDNHSHSRKIDGRARSTPTHRSPTTSRRRGHIEQKEVPVLTRSSQVPRSDR